MCVYTYIYIYIYVYVLPASELVKSALKSALVGRSQRCET